MNFKTICSNSNFFNSKFKIANRWSNIDEYENLLGMNFNKLKYPSKLDLLKLIHSLFFVYKSVYNNNSYFETTICKSLNLSAEEFYNLTYVKSRTKISYSKQNKLKKLLKNNLGKINKKVSNNIWEVKV